MLNSEPRVSDWLQLVRSEFIEMPGLCLTRPQAERLWGLDPIICEALLQALVDAEFLRRTRDGLYLRNGNATALRPPVRPLEPPLILLTHRVCATFSIAEAVLAAVQRPFEPRRQ